MLVGIQRRSIYLAPPVGLELIGVSRFLENREVTAAFNLRTPVPPWQFRNMVKHGLCVVGVLRRVSDRTRLGFVCMFAPDLVEHRTWWEIAAAIEKPEHRDAFSMLHAVDAMTHYMFDHLKVESCGSSVKQDNAASLAVGKRLGHKPVGMEMDQGVPHVLYRLNKEDWAARRAKLEEGEKRFPSPGGAAFVTLHGPPYVPVESPP